MPKGLVVEGSFNNKNWTEVDKQFVDDELNKENLIRTFSCSKTSSFKYYRFRQHVTNSRGYNIFTLSKIEVYGIIILKEKTCKFNNSLVNYNFVLIIVFFFY